MGTCRKSPRNRVAEFERCEDRALAALIFVFNGNGFGDAHPDALTADAARLLERGGNQVVQLSNPAFGTPGVVRGVAQQILALSHGQPIGLVGFSAGGTLALHLAGMPALHVTAVLDDYGPPDVRDFLAEHHGDRFASYVLGHGHFTTAGINLLSGPVATSAHVDAAFGLSDPNILAGPSTVSIGRDFPGSQVYYYPGPHGVPIGASPPALLDFLAHV